MNFYENIFISYRKFWNCISESEIGSSFVNTYIFQAIKMTIFELIKNDFAIVGIESHKSIQSHSIFSTRNLIFSFLNAYEVIAVLLHIFCDDNTFREYIDSAYRCSGMSLTALLLGYFIWKAQNIFEFINDFEESVQQSE